METRDRQPQLSVIRDGLSSEKNGLSGHRATENMNSEGR